MKSIFPIALLMCICLCPLVSAQESNNVKLKFDPEKLDEGIEVLISGDTFCKILCTNVNRPMVYPVFAPGGVQMTRDFPQKKGTEGEANDHPHHTSIWFGHGDINGASFWHLQNAMVRTEGILNGIKEGAQFIETQSNWIAEQEGEKKLLASSSTKYYFGGDDTKRWIDFDCTMTAKADELTFGDTKEGTFALRSHPQLRLDNDPGRGVTKANGQAINSEGVKGKDIWGKNAKWVSYWGKVDGDPVGFAIMDHPENFRHPTTWHARAYGLVAANPFGLHDFQGKPQGSGNHTIKKGEKIRFRYRILLYSGEFNKELVDQNFKQYSSQK